MIRLLVLRFILIASTLLGILVLPKILSSVLPKSSAIGESSRGFQRTNIPISLEGISLKNVSGEELSEKKLLNHWTLVFFGYTSCPDICPISLALMAKILNQWRKENADLPPLHGLFISVDPKRDTPESLGRYVASFNTDIEGMTGDSLSIRKFANQFQAAYEPDGKSDLGLINHSSSLYLINPEGKLAGEFVRPKNSELILDQIRRML